MTFLTNIKDALIEIFEADSWIITNLTDTLKQAKPVIFNNPLTWEQLNKPYNLSVHHTCREIPKTINGVTYIKGIIYIDLGCKVPKDEIVTDKLDEFAWKILEILYKQDPSLLDTVDSWEWIDKGIWKQSPSGNDQIPEKKLMNYICQITLACNYVSDNSDNY